MRTYNFDNLYFGPYFVITREERDYETYFSSNQFMPNVKRKARFMDYGIFEKNKNGLIINPQTEKNILQRDTIIYQDTYCLLGIGTKYVNPYLLQPLKNYCKKVDLSKFDLKNLTKFDIEKIVDEVKKTNNVKSQKNEFEL